MDSEQLVDEAPPKQDRSALWIAGVLGGIVLLAIVIGLSTGGGSRRPYDQLGVETGGVDNLELAIDAVKQRTSNGRTPGLERALSYLNRWADQGKVAKADWKLDPLFGQLPGDLKSEQFVPNLSRNDFVHFDLAYLQEAIWAREISHWVVAQPPNPELAKWFEKVEEKSGAETRLQLTAAERLFDWTICNLALDEFPPAPKAPVAGAGDSPESLAPSRRGLAGPGYARTPTLSFLMGRGDAWERSRAFICLARQAGLEVVMLGIQGDGVERDKDVKASQPWLAAALIGGKLYLFDAQLGLPIPGPGGEGIATLDDIVADPKLLRDLDLKGIGEYPIRAADLDRVVAMIDAPLYGLSRRMKVLESELVGARRVKLAAFGAELPDRLKAVPHVNHVILWRVPLDADLFTESSHQLRRLNPQMQLQYYLQFGSYVEASPLRQGREAYFRGDFTQEAPKLGAREYFLSCRLSEAQLREIAVSGEAWRVFGVPEAPKTAAERQKYTDAYLGVLRRTKEDATHFLGLVLYEEGAHDLSYEWFRDRLVENKAAADSPWVGPGRYTLGRSAEALGKWSEAREQYLTDSSPQRYGNILRATMIKRRHTVE